MSVHRTGVVAILGRPNVGKSTLLNAILGEKLAIVTAKPQTTRSRILGIHSRPDAQILFVDTPGLHASEKTLNAQMNAMADEAARDCDVALLLVEQGARWSDDHATLAGRLRERGAPVFAIGTKHDLAARRPEAPGWPPPDAERAFYVSARTGEGVDALIEAIVARLPESPPLYPEDEISDRPLRFLAAELVREAAFESLEQELPYVLGVEVVEFDTSRDDGVRVRANLIVERASQKQIVIGEGGARIKRIGIRARREIEQLVEGRAHLALWVKVEPGWTRKTARIRALGYV